MTGVGEYLKKQNADIQIVAVEPESSAVLSTGIGGSHKIQGIGAGFVPEILNTSVYDEIITVKDEDAFATGKLIGYKEGILVGISSGAALWAAIPVSYTHLDVYKRQLIRILSQYTGSDFGFPMEDKRTPPLFACL